MINSKISENPGKKEDSEERKSIQVDKSKNRRISITNPNGEIKFYDGPENDWGIYTRYQTIMAKRSSLKVNKGKKHIDFLKDDESFFKRRSNSSRKNNTRKYNSKHSHVMGITMDNINELDEEAEIEESWEKESKKLAKCFIIHRTHRKKPKKAKETRFQVRTEIGARVFERVEEL